MWSLDRWAWRQAAKSYGRRLGAELSKAYGGLPPYTPEQVAAAVRRLRLDARRIALGYAPFVSEADYRRLAPQLPKQLPREEALELFERFRPFRPVTGGGFQPAAPSAWD